MKSFFWKVCPKNVFRKNRGKGGKKFLREKGLCPIERKRKTVLEFKLTFWNFKAFKLGNLGRSL